MEQTTQQTIQKPPLPIKTKIAALWMTAIIMIGIITGVIGLWLRIELGIFYIPSVLSILLPPCLFIFRRKKLGWYWGIITLSGIIIAATMIISYVLFLAITGEMPTDPASGIVIAIFFYSSIFLLIIFLPPFLLLFLDRKNFWKIAS